MDYEKYTLEELKRGYFFDEVSSVYGCIFCGQSFFVGQVYPIGGEFFDAKHGVLKHINQKHESVLEQLIHSKTKYNTFTENQKELLTLFDSGMSDTEIAQQLNISASTVRHQKFTFREKAKQAKMYLAIYEQVFDKEHLMENMPDVAHIKATNNPFEATNKAKEQVLNAAFESLSPLKLKVFPRKEKRKIVVLSKISEEFEHDKRYSEKEVIELLGKIFHDHALIRRYLIDFGFLGRTNDGKEYWLL